MVVDDGSNDEMDFMCSIYYRGSKHRELDQSKGLQEGVLTFGETRVEQENRTREMRGDRRFVTEIFCLRDRICLLTPEYVPFILCQIGTFSLLT